MSRTAHQDPHSERGALRGEHPGRSRNPVIKVADLAWLEFEKPDLARAEVFALDFGFPVAARTPDAPWLRGTFGGPPCMVIRRGRTSRFVGPAFRAAERADLDRLARATGSAVREADVPGGGRAVGLLDPSGFPVRVVHCGEELPALPAQVPLVHNFGTARPRTNATQRPPREPARIQRLGHVVLETRVFGRALDRYLDTLGMIVSDFLFLDGQRDRGPTMAFVRCDQGGRAVGPPHAGHASGPGQRLCPLRLPGDRPGRDRRRRGVPGRARLPAQLGHRPAHPGQPALRLLARPRPGCGGTATGSP